MGWHRRAWVVIAIALGMGVSAHEASARMIAPRPASSAPATMVAPPAHGGAGAPARPPMLQGDMLVPPQGHVELGPHRPPGARPFRPTTVVNPTPRVQVSIESVEGPRARDRAAVTTAVRRVEGRIARCYSDGLRRDPSTQGLVIVRFEVAPDGTIQEPTSPAHYVQDEATVQCIVGQFEGVRLARTAAAAPTRVVVRVRLALTP